jgi:hypothetical protein
MMRFASLARGLQNGFGGFNHRQIVNCTAQSEATLMSYIKHEVST